MFASILYKEYIKLRAYWLVVFLFNLIVVGYVFLRLRNLFIVDHAEIVWYTAFTSAGCSTSRSSSCPLQQGCSLQRFSFCRK